MRTRAEMAAPMAALVALLAGAAPAVAQDRPRGNVEAPDWHPYVFSSDGELLRPRAAAAESGAGYNGVPASGSGLAPDDARIATGWLAGAIGLGRRIELDGLFGYAGDAANGYQFEQTRLAVRIALLAPGARLPLAIAIGGGYQADALVDHAATAALDASAHLGRLNLTLNVRAVHYFQAGRDPIDVFVTAGAMVRATGWLRLGVEYVGEELEALVGDDGDHAPGGRHYVGPTAALFFAHGHVRVNATAGALLTPGQLGPLLRGAIAYVY